MKALIMAAGYGTRLEPLTLAVPKPMVPIVNKPTMQHNLELLRRNGIRSVICNIHYHPEQIQNFFGDGDDFGVDITYSFEEELLGTAGGVKKMAKICGGIKETFLVLSSDALTDINLRKLIEFHKKKKSLVTMALSEVEDPSHFGVVVLDKDGKVENFVEKPKKEHAPSNLVNTGIYVFEPEVLDMIPDNNFYDFGKELFPKLIGTKHKMFGYKMIGYWSDVGGLQAYIKANYDAMQGNVRLFLPGKKTSSNVWLGKNCQIDDSVVFEGCVIIGNHVKIGPGAIVKDAVIGDRAYLGSKTKIEGSIIWSDTFIQEETSIFKSVIGSWCKIGAKTTIDENSIVGNRCHIGPGHHLTSETKLKPNEVI